MTKTPVIPSLLIAACAATIISLPIPVRAADVTRVAEREIVRRQDRVTEADVAIQAGDEAMSNDEYDQAAAQYKLAVDYLPDALATGSQRSTAMEKFSDASIKLAEQRINEGRFADAQAVIVRLVEADPENGKAKTMLQHLAEPDYYNKTVGPKFVASVEEVKKKLSEAEGYYDSGRYDFAIKRCEQVLAIDPYNVAARRMEEKINKARNQYSRAGYDHARSEAVWEVDKAWDRPVIKYGSGNTTIIRQDESSITGTAYITNKLNTIIIPKIEFRDATIREAIDYLKNKSRDLDPESDPSKKGVNIVLKLDTSYRSPGASQPAAPAGPVIPGLETPVAPTSDTASALPPSDPTASNITLSLTNVPMIEALKYITNLANLKYKIEPFAVSIVPLSTPTDDLITKQYQVSPGFIQGTVAAGDASATPGGDAAGAGAKIAARVGARAYLESQGVAFPPGSSAVYQTGSSRLIVTNTQSALDLVDTLVEIDRGNAPKQVEIESKFVEITQNNNKELGFDWLLGQFNIDKSERVYAGGGTAGNTPGLVAGDYPFVNPSNAQIVGQNPITAGNRSGGTAISANAIDALLFGLTGNTLKAPGVFGLSGVFTDPQFQLVIRALDQKKGVDLLSSPRVTTKSGMRAVIEIVREFRYPTEFDPPQIPQTVGSTGGSLGGGGSSNIPVTPTTPTTFETRNTGVTLEVEPQVGPDGQTIDLTLAPSVTEFEGFINYGSPILAPPSTTPIFNAIGNLVGFSTTPSSVITPNVINQPIFSTRKVTTQVSIWDGQTIVIGGLMREDVQKVEDKTPLLGDIPFFGRLFRSNAEQHLKRNLVIFVTARLMNPAGQPVLSNELEEETIESLPLTEITQQVQPLPNFAK